MIAPNRLSVEKPSIAIVGGGMMGICSALRLADAGKYRITLFEKAPALGGLSSYYCWNDVCWDRFYHVVLSTDAELIGFLQSLGLDTTQA